MGEIQEHLDYIEQYFRDSEDLVHHVHMLKFGALNYDKKAEKEMKHWVRLCPPNKKVKSFKEIDDRFYILSIGGSKSAFLVENIKYIFDIFNSLDRNDQNKMDLFQVILAISPQFPVISHQCDDEQLSSLINLIKEYYRDPRLKIDTQNKNALIINKLYNDKSEVDVEFLKLSNFLAIKNKDLKNLISLPKMEINDEVQYFKHHLKPAKENGNIAPINIMINYGKIGNAIQGNTYSGHGNDQSINNFSPPKKDETVTDYYARTNEGLPRKEFEERMKARGYKKKHKKTGTQWVK